MIYYPNYIWGKWNRTINKFIESCVVNQQESRITVVLFRISLPISNTLNHGISFLYPQMHIGVNICNNDSQRANLFDSKNWSENRISIPSGNFSISKLVFIWIRNKNQNIHVSPWTKVCFKITEVFHFDSINFMWH